MRNMSYLCFTSGKLTLLNNLFCLCSLCNEIWYNSEDNPSYSKNISTLQGNIVGLMAGSEPKNSSRNYFKKLRDFAPSVWIFSLINFIVKPMQMYTILIQGISVILSDKMTNLHIFWQVPNMLA